MQTKLTQQNIPNGWTPTKVGELGFTYSGLRSKNKTDFGHGAPFITYMNIFTNSKIDKNRFDLVDVDEEENQSKVKYGDVFFTVSSETPEEVGMSSVLLDEVDNYYLNSFCFGFRLNGFNSLIPQYARYLFRGRDFRSKIMKMAQGSTRFNLSKDRVLSLDITLPPIKEQQKIAEIMGTVDEDIAKTQEVIEATERLKRGLMQQLFTRGIGHTKLKETKIGQIPEGWDFGGFKNLVNPDDKNAIKPGPFGSALKKNFYVEKGFKIYGQEQVISGDAFYGDYYVNEEKYKEMEGFKVNAGDILISLVGTIGKILIVPGNYEKGIINPRLLKITPDSTKADSQFIAHLLKSDFLIQQMSQKSHGGTMNILNKGMLMSVGFGVPPLKEQKEIAEILSAVDEKISINKKLKDKLNLLKKGLMQDLLSGKVRVNI
ncbi:MAG: restriction endonuclease subunit S [Patescibacteria group bacterium]|jgi:type I restriction enzyme S subunit